MTMSIADRLLLADLKRRVEALERDQSNGRQPLRERNARRKADGARLRGVIQKIQNDSGVTSAKRVLQSLARAGVNPLPALRTVQWHLAQLRNTSALR